MHNCCSAFKFSSGITNSQSSDAKWGLRDYASLKWPCQIILIISKASAFKRRVSFQNQFKLFFSIAWFPSSAAGVVQPLGLIVAALTNQKSRAKVFWNKTPQLSWQMLKCYNIFKKVANKIYLWLKEGSKTTIIFVEPSVIEFDSLEDDLSSYEPWL